MGIDEVGLGFSWLVFVVRSEFRSWAGFILVVVMTVFVGLSLFK